MDVTDNITKHFTITCSNCGSDKVEVDFYAGFISECDGINGFLDIFCTNCKYKLEVEDE